MPFFGKRRLSLTILQARLYRLRFTVLVQGTPPYTNGTYSPEITMRGYNQNSASGNWRFLNLDIGAGDAPGIWQHKDHFSSHGGSQSGSTAEQQRGFRYWFSGMIPQSSYIEKDFLPEEQRQFKPYMQCGFIHRNVFFKLLAEFHFPAQFTGDSALFRVRANNAMGLKNGGNTLGSLGAETALWI